MLVVSQTQQRIKFDIEPMTSAYKQRRRAEV
jgi:hypothetical protein